MNVFSRLCNSLWPSPLCCYQMNGIDIRLGYTNLRGILDGKQTICYKSILDILILMFSGINKCSQGCNIFMIDFGSSRYQNFIISLICISAEFPAYSAPLVALRNRIYFGVLLLIVRTRHFPLSYEGVTKTAIEALRHA